jgi:AraC-like DNA-binding protein
MKTSESRVFVRPEYSIEQRVFRKRPVNRVTRDYSIIAVLAGQCRIEIAGNNIDFDTGNIILLNPNQSCAFSAIGKSTELLILLLPASHLYQIAGQLQIASDSELLFRELSIRSDNRVRFLIQTLSEELRLSQAGRNVVIDTTVSQIIVHLLRNLMTVRRGMKLELSRFGVVDRRLRRAIEFMYLHSAEELSLSEIAREAFLSAYHFARLFKRITGLTPHNYLANIRIEQARHLLGTSDLSINAIATRVGYDSQSHFAKVFRAATGLTPKEFRNAAIQRQ